MLAEPRAGTWHRVKHQVASNASNLNINIGTAECGGGAHFLTQQYLVSLTPVRIKAYSHNMCITNRYRTRLQQYFIARLRFPVAFPHSLHNGWYHHQWCGITRMPAAGN